MLFLGEWANYDLHGTTYSRVGNKEELAGEITVEPLNYILTLLTTDSPPGPRQTETSTKCIPVQAV